MKQANKITISDYVKMDKPRDMSLDISKDRAKISCEYFSSPIIILPIPKKFDGEPNHY